MTGVRSAAEVLPEAEALTSRADRPITSGWGKRVEPYSRALEEVRRWWYDPHSCAPGA